MVEDYREARDRRIRERQVHLNYRRSSGAPLVGGQSEAQVTIGSDSGLVQTETIELNAVSEIAVIFDDTQVTLTADYDDEQILETLQVEGSSGSRLIVRATDHVDDFELILITAIELIYFLRIKNSAGTVLEESRYDAFLFQDGGGFIFTSAAAGPVLSVLQDMEDGEIYTVEFGFLRTRVDPTEELLDVLSGARRIEVQELKR